jgi:hypothetical protein
MPSKLIEPAEEIEQGGLAAAGRADDGDRFACSDPEVQVPQDGDRTRRTVVVFGYAGYLNHGRKLQEYVGDEANQCIHLSPVRE